MSITFPKFNLPGAFMPKKLTIIIVCLSVLFIATSTFAAKKKIAPPTKTVDFTYNLSPEDAIHSGVLKYTLSFYTEPKITYYLNQPRGEFIDFVKMYDICSQKNAKKNLTMFTKHYATYGLVKTSAECINPISYSSE